MDTLLELRCLTVITTAGASRTRQTQLERNGLDLGSAKELALSDFRKDGLGWLQLKNTGRASVTVRPVSDANETPTPIATLSATDQKLLDQIRGKVEGLDKANGRAFDETSERMSASLSAAAKNAGITQADHVVLSKQTQNSPAAQNICVVQGDMADPAALRTHTVTVEAAQRSVQDSMIQVEAIGQRQARERATEMQRSQEQQQRASQPSL